MPKRIRDTKTLSWYPHHIRLSFEFKIEDSEMTEYVVQLEYNDGDYADEDWKQVARFDTSHDFFHIDLHYADGTKQKHWNTLPQYLDTDEEFNKARAYLVRKSTELTRKTGYVED